MLFDTHCHLSDPRLLNELDAVLERAAEAGVRRITSIGCASDVASVTSAIEIARRHPGPNLGDRRRAPARRQASR